MFLRDEKDLERKNKEEGNTLILYLYLFYFIAVSPPRKWKELHFGDAGDPLVHLHGNYSFLANPVCN